MTPSSLVLASLRLVRPPELRMSEDALVPATRFWLLLTLVALALAGVLWIERSPFAVFGILVAIGCAAVATVTANASVGSVPSGPGVGPPLSAQALTQLAARREWLAIETALYRLAEQRSRAQLLHALRGVRELVATLDGLPSTGLSAALAPRAARALEESSSALWVAAERASVIGVGDAAHPRVRQALDAQVERVAALARALEDARASVIELLLSERAERLEDAEQALRRLARNAESLGLASGTGRADDEPGSAG